MSAVTLTPELEEKVKRLQGPILVIGGSGFIGANLFKTILKSRPDVYATTSRLPAWRLEDSPALNLIATDLLVDSNLDRVLEQIKPRTIFNCIAYGAYSFETDSQLIYQTNFNFISRLLLRLEKRNISCYVHAGSSSEYGDNSAGPSETDLPAPNSDYAVSKVASANLLYYYGKKKAFPCANLRLYSVYGPLEDSSRLIPNLIRFGVEGRFPDFVSPDISRDFIYVTDVCEAFVDTALNLKAENYGEAFNIGSGHKTTIGDIATFAGEFFKIETAPVFTMPNRSWDVSEWFANIQRSHQVLNWQPRTPFQDGLEQMVTWYNSLSDKAAYLRASKKYGLDTKYSVSAIIACYRDNQAIPIMYQRLKDTFTRLNIDYQIIFVNDNSPDDSEEVIRGISRNDPRVLGISHSRNFGSQAAFKSGMELATKNACVLLDGDLQDPPELIEKFVEKWREGYNVVYGQRVKRDAPFYMQMAYKLFYRLFDYFSYLSIPHDAGDFALIDKKVVQAMLLFPERDLFLRGVRAFVGFKQIGINYVRPERMFGRSTNNLAKNIGWAKKGILSFSNVPLNILSTFGVILLFISFLLGLLQIIGRLLFPDLAVSGITTVLLVILFFGSINLFAVGLVGEYIAKIFEEVKQRPHFIRRSIILDGETRAASDTNASRGYRRKTDVIN
jgi:dolichol-phosphate mannosyltransferase